MIELTDDQKKAVAAAQETFSNLKNNTDLKVIYIDVSDLNFVESENHYLELLFRIKSKLGKSVVKFPD